MRTIAIVAAAAAVALPLAIRAQSPLATAGCESEGAFEFICGRAMAEDLVAVPGTRFVLASSLRGEGGGVRLVDGRARSITMLYPTATSRDRLDRKLYGQCPGPLDAETKANFNTHGLALRALRRGVYRVFVVHHGKRESIEVFELQARGDAPSLTWVGCVVAPDKVSLNSVVGLDDGGFLASNIQERTPDPVAERAKRIAGQVTGDLQEWHPGKGWAKVPGSEASGPNGVELSRDGRWVYTAGWGNRVFIRLRRGAGAPMREEVPLGFRGDNLRWAPDGSLLVAGQGEKRTHVAKVDPATLEVTELVNQPDTPAFGAGTVAIRFGKELWIGSYQSPRIAVTAVP